MHRLHRKNVLGLLLISAAGLSAAEIQFKPQANIRGSLVLLGDVAEVRSSDPEEVESLRRTELFPVPSRSRTRTLQMVELQQLLQLHGIQSPEHRFSGSPSTRITRSNASQVQSQPAANEVAQPPVVVAKRPIAIGAILRAVDVELQVPEKPLSNMEVADSVEAVVGHESTRSFSAGQPIDTRVLRRPILVRRGEAVEVVAKAAGVRVRTTAKALGQGCLGELVSLETTKDGEHITAVVTGLRQAEIFAGSHVIRSENTSVEKQVGANQ